MKTEYSQDILRQAIHALAPDDRKFDDEWLTNQLGRYYVNGGLAYDFRHQVNGLASLIVAAECRGRDAARLNYLHTAMCALRRIKGIVLHPDVAHATATEMKLIAEAAWIELGDPSL
jgi:hypothetical protein